MKYFLHNSSAFEDEKIAELFLNFGYEGIGIFFTLLEKLARNESPIKTSVLKSLLGLTKRQDKCWQFMENIGLIHSNNGETFNENLIKYSGKYLKNKEKTNERVKTYRLNKELNKNVTCYNTVTTPLRNANVTLPNINNNNINNNKEEPDKSGSDFIKILLDGFCSEYKRIRGMDFELITPGKERTGISKILQAYKKQNPTKNSNETKTELIAFFIKCLNITDKWHCEKMSPIHIASNLNQIKLILNGNLKTNLNNEYVTHVFGDAPDEMPEIYKG